MDSLLGIPIGVASLDVAISDAVKAIERRNQQIVFACANSNSLNVSMHDEVFRSALSDADQLVADGVGVSIISRLAGKDVGPRIVGQQYFEHLMSALSTRGEGRVFFFGSSEGVLEQVEKRFSKVYPSLTFAGSISPPFADWSDDLDDSFVARINSSAADVLWVGMTAPKQEKWVYKNRDKLTIPVIGSIGAVFDFFGGTVSPCPEWLRKAGLEALFRLVVEPRRLWRRVLISNVNFIRVGLWQEVLRKSAKQR